MDKNFLLKIIKFFQFLSLLFILLGVPLIYLPHAFLMYEIPKIVFFRMGILVFGGLLIFERVLLKLPLFSFQKWRVLQIKKTHVFYVLLLIFWLGFVWWMSPNRITFFWGNYDKRFGLYTLLYLVFFLIFLIYFFKKNNDLFKEIFPFFIPIPILVNLSLCYSQYYRGSLNLYLTEGRVVGTFGQSNFLAGFVLLLTPLLLYYLVKTKDWVLRIYLLISLVSTVLLIFWTGSRMSTVLFFGIIGLYLLFFALKNKKISKKVKISSILLFVFLVLVGFFNISGRLRQFGIVDDTRKLIWKSSIDLIKGSPIWGYGFDVSGYLFPTAMYDNGVDTSIALDRAHNEILDIVLNTGLIGLILFLIPHLILLRKYIFILFKTKDKIQQFYLIALLSSFSLFWLRSMVNVNGIYHYVFYVFILSLMIHEILHMYKKDMLEMNSKFLSWFIGLIFLFLMVMNLKLNVNFLLADIQYQQKTYNSLTKSVELNPYQIRYRLELMQLKENFELEEVISKKFLDQKEYWGEYYNRIGRYYHNIGEEKLADEYIQRAVEKEPQKEDYD